MTKKSVVARALLSSVLALILCVTMLIGTTYAWFTDSVTSGSNVITSGNLDLDVQYTLDGENWKDLNGATNLFQKGLWEPGHTEVVALRITNNGSLALKYIANMNIVDETIGKTKDGEDIVLSDILTVTTVTQQVNVVGDILLGMVFGGSEATDTSNTKEFKSSNILAQDQDLQPGDAHYLIITVDMAETVGNEANHDGKNAPSIEFGINVLATQFTKEEDSFGSNYDKDAQYIDVNELLESVKNGEDVVLKADFAVTPNTELLMESDGEVSFDGNGKVITAQGTGTKPGESYDYGYVGFIPANGKDAVVNNVTVTGSGFVEVGHHGTSTNGNYTVNNMVIKDLKATLAINNCGNNIAAAFSHYGKATLTDCVMTGTTTLKGGFKPYDAAFVNGTKTQIVGGTYGNVYLANQAHVTITGAEIDVIDSYAIITQNLGKLTIGEGAKIGTINLYDTGSYKATLTIEAGAEVGKIVYNGVPCTQALTIEDGATVGAIVYNGDTYTQAQWMAR